MGLPENSRDYLQKYRTRFIDELVGLLKIPSISSLPEHKADVFRAGEWTAIGVQLKTLAAVESLSKQRSASPKGKIFQ